MKVDVTIRSNNGTFDMPCALCGVAYKTDVAAARVRIDGEYVGAACEQCLEAGGGGVKQRIRSQAASLRRQADYLDSLAAADIDLPSPAELAAAIEQSAREIFGKAYPLGHWPELEMVQ